MPKEIEILFCPICKFYYYPEYMNERKKFGEHYFTTRQRKKARHSFCDECKSGTQTNKWLILRRSRYMSKDKLNMKDKKRLRWSARFPYKKP